ncbi:hypothetical protein ACFSHQ_13140 [Gemmobacter lanyuensis]
MERNLIQMQPPLAEENRCEWPEAPSPAGDASSFDAALSKGWTWICGSICAISKYL